MRIVPRFVLLFAVVLVWSSNTSPAFAGDVVDQAIGALGSNPVYIAPNTEGTTKTTANELSDRLNENDHIVLVMLPQGATAASAEDVAARILGSLKESSTLGLYINGQTSGYSTRLPMTVIPDLMTRANSVARTPQESLAIFVKLVHEYQAAHPEPTPTPTQVQEPVQQPSGPNLFLVTLIILIIAAVGGTIVYFKKRDPHPVRHAPGPVSEQLYRIKRLMDDVKDPEMTSLMGDIIKDSGVFFKRAKGLSDADTQGFAKRLRTAIELLHKYVEIQDEPRYAPNPPGADALLHSGRIAIKGLSNSILKAVRDENASAVLQFQMQADLLSMDFRTDYR